MVRFETVYNFNVLDELTNGEVVYFIDKQSGEIDRVNDMPTADMAIAIKDENKNNRYEFYKVVEVDE